MNASMSKRVLIVLHQAHSTPGRIGRLLTERGLTLDIRRPPCGDLLPETLEEHAGVGIFGGPMSANDHDDYVKQEIKWMEVPLREEKPFFGICLGAQILARALGTKVDFHPEGLVEVGYYPLRATEAGKKLFEWPDYVYQWHREGFDLPPDAVLLAEGDAFRNQAFQYGRAAFAFQFHSELTHQMMCRWTTRGHARLELPNARPRAAHFDDRLVHDGKTRAWLEKFFDLWTGLAKKESHQAPSVSQNAKGVADCEPTLP
jgi:GMP synthase (glutamine-hydrolysing)